MAHFASMLSRSFCLQRRLCMKCLSFFFKISKLHLFKKKCLPSRPSSVAVRGMGMHSRTLLAYAVLFGHALSATLPTASRRKDDPITSSSKRSISEYVSAIAANISSSHSVPDVNLFAPKYASQLPSNYSDSIYDLPLRLQPARNHHVCTSVQRFYIRQQLRST